jgi:acyl dehydratase
MDDTSQGASIDHTPAQGAIGDAAIEAARRMIGLQLRPEGPYLQDATADTIRNFSNGIGDLNPLYRDSEYGRTSRYAAMLAHPMFPMAYGWLGRTRWGVAGVHGFYAGNDWEMFRHVRPGDRLTCIERVVGVDVKQSQFSGRLAIQYVQAHFMNQRDERVVASNIPASVTTVSRWRRIRVCPAPTTTVRSARLGLRLW